MSKCVKMIDLRTKFVNRECLPSIRTTQSTNFLLCEQVEWSSVLWRICTSLGGLFERAVQQQPVQHIIIGRGGTAAEDRPQQQTQRTAIGAGTSFRFARGRSVRPAQRRRPGSLSFTSGSSSSGSSSSAQRRRCTQLQQHSAAGRQHARERKSWQNC